MKIMRLGPSSGLVLMAALAAGACERRGNQPQTDGTDREPQRTTPERAEAPRTSERTGVSSPAPAAAANESAVFAITKARCDREMRCDNVGSGKKYDSLSACFTKTRADWRDDLNARECPQGVVSSQLSSCVDQIRSESCANPVERLESVLACRTVDLCKRG